MTTNLLRPTRLAAAGLLLAGAAAAAPAPLAPAEPLAEVETTGVTALHRSAVETFIGRPGFGGGRMIVIEPLDDILTRHKSAAEGGGQVVAAPGAEFVPPGPTQQAAAKDRKPAHFSLEAMVADGPAARTLRAAGDGKEQWRLRGLQLIGLVTHDEPVAYESGRVPAAMEKPAAAKEKTEKVELKTRKLDAFETLALQAFEDGKGLTAEKRGTELRAVGPIYAGQKCVGCHDQKGRLLGAFSYRLDRVAVTLPVAP